MFFCQVFVFISKTIQQVLIKRSRLLECDAVSLDKLFSTFRKKVSHSSSGVQRLRHGHRETLNQLRSLTFPKTEILDYRAVKSLKLTQVWIISDTGDLHVKISTEVGCNSCGSIQTEIVQHMI
jgi:hypothetical protein